MSSLLMTLLVGQLYIGKIGERVYIDSLKCFALNSPNQRFYICVNTRLAQFDLICKALGSQKLGMKMKDLST